MGRVAVGLGGISSTLVALGYLITTEYDASKKGEGGSEEVGGKGKARRTFDVVSLRPCKKGEVVDAKRVYDSAFLLNPSSRLKKGPLPESQLAGKGFKTFVICLRDPWPMVLDSVDKVLGDKELVVGDAFCAASPQPAECFASFLAMAALGKRRGEMVVAYPGRPPADPACVAERLLKAKECYLGKRYVSVEAWEQFKRLIDYVYAKVPLGSIKALYAAAEEGVSPFYLFSYPCFYSKQEDCAALRRKGPNKFRKPKKPCTGDIMEVLAELR
ncbi:hypothetical protein Igni_0734 [Ignicoccus hospitalis KIN4/I]|uniref:Uncharacterized protein n=1 Tax=Ignicoccus hospitalis (strain KIN4/I / DSM 18386 / JCM 14125) TaxID=453591 RepID=A8AAG4_IGNH4|nr:hypothetical protein Igni_0734 [Ignicoccus hospitalis KIN4/I]